MFSPVDGPEVELLPDGVRVKLLAPYSFTDPENVAWTAPVGFSNANGASIPRFLWSCVGSPWTGRYRDASILHDYYCTTQSRPWQQTHRMFFQACVASGVNLWFAWLMYTAIVLFGPHWDPPTSDAAAPSA